MVESEEFSQVIYEAIDRKGVNVLRCTVSTQLPDARRAEESSLAKYEDIIRPAGKPHTCKIIAVSVSSNATNQINQLRYTARKWVEQNFEGMRFSDIEQDPKYKGCSTTVRQMIEGLMVPSA